MIYCCGASMIGTIDAMRKKSIKVNRVPLLFCPVCHDVKVHPAIKEQFDLVLEYALEDRVHETTLYEQIDPDMIKRWREDCFSFQGDDLEVTIREQIDLALDLLRISKADQQWAEELKTRLKVLSQRLHQLEQQKESTK
ncbi:hypothetical protein [Risungbinella massiliensis]|uniref:hypothetical protein n=1 Tax=Risungbinella massiliensis TaxID=1329796 RepID=UPI0005CBD5D4|nr:hypothetical protein [Risungbinella massiliensis]